MINVFDCFAGNGGYLNPYNNYYLMVNQYTFKFLLTKKQLQKFYFKENKTYSEIAEIKNVSVKRIQNLMKKFNLKPRKQIPRNQFGINNPSWKGGIFFNKHTGYWYVKSEKHHQRSIRGYIALHQKIFEDFLGRQLKFYSFNNSKNEIVHHIDGNKENNSISNLKLMTCGEHISFHCKGKRY